MSIKRISQGDGLPAFSAQTWGAFCDMAEQWMLERGIQIVRNQFSERDSGLVLVSNGSGDDIGQGAILEITGTPFVPNTNYTEPVSAEPYYTRRANLRAFLGQVVLSGVAPSTDASRLAVAIAPARDGAVVRAIVSGVAHVRVSMQSEEHEFARVVDGESGYMESAASGPAKLLYVQPESERDPGDADNLAWCVVMLGGGGGGSEYFPVKVKKDGGAAGDAADPCSWTYSVYTIDAPTLTSDYLLDTGLTPKLARTAIGPYQYAPDGSEGMCRYQNGDIVLCVAWGEVPEVVECAT